MQSFSKFMLATGAAAAVTTGAMIPRPASADTTSTLLTAAAAIGAIVLYSNYQHKQAAANSIVGYTRNGGTVYADGRVVMPDGQTYYPNSNGQYAYANNGTYNGAYNGNANGAYNGAYNGNANGAYNGAYNGTRRSDYNGNAGYANGRQHDAQPAAPSAYVARNDSRGNHKDNRGH
jgi:hypothetical protein